MKPRNLQLQQMDKKMRALANLPELAPPPTGWLRAIRSSIGMSLEQFGKKLGSTRQSARALENREKEGAVSINTLRQAAAALDMEFVYGFVPKDGSLEKLIKRKSLEKARQIVGMASQTMQLENQANTEERLSRAILERANEVREKTPKILWD